MPWWARTEIIAPVCTVLGVLLGSVVSLIGVFINRRFDDRRHLREIAVKTAYSHWERQLEIVQRRSDSTGKTHEALPLEGFIVHMLLLSDFISRKKIREESIAGELARIRRVSDAVFDAAPDASTDKSKKAD